MSAAGAVERDERGFSSRHWYPRGIKARVDQLRRRPQDPDQLSRHPGTRRRARGLKRALLSFAVGRLQRRHSDATCRNGLCLSSAPVGPCRDIGIYRSLEPGFHRCP